ncbi:hypothetical protein [Streptomyces flaveus]|uniref:hypothetical protein n=1 Tax=Streptomyces flaveus TaxID=66370 RepID=UPI0033265D14
MRRQITARALETGDYLCVAAMRLAPDGKRPDEGYARIERIEHIDNPSFLTQEPPQGWRGRMARQLTVVFCQGLPGPLLIEAREHWILTDPPTQRRQWDEAHPSWANSPAPFFINAHPPKGRHPRRGESPKPSPPDGSSPRTLPPTAHRCRALSFSKPATAVMTGDYLQIHAARHPEQDMAPDEGFHRIEHVAHLPEDAVPHVLARPEWAHGPLVVLDVSGMPGTLVLPSTSQRVLVAPNPERGRQDEEDPWSDSHTHMIAGMQVPDEEDLVLVDRALRPIAPVDETDLYPSMFDDPARRDLYLRGTVDVHPVAAAELPWPHGLFKCEYATRWKRLKATYPEAEQGLQVARAELFASLSEDDFAACPYHQADWQAIARTALDIAAAHGAGDEETAERLATLQHLDETDRPWAHDLLHDHIHWDSGDTALTNGQHRLCAMRAAGVTHVPVYGRRLPDQAAGAARKAAEHAHATVEQYWSGQLTKVWGSPRFAGSFVRFPFLRRLLPRHRDQ